MYKLYITGVQCLSLQAENVKNKIMQFDKLIKALIIFVLLLIAQNLSAQYRSYEPNSDQNGIQPGYYKYSMLKTNPFPVLYGHIPMTSEYRLIYETAFAPRHSINIGAAYMGKNIIIPDAISSDYISDPAEISAEGYRLILNYRFIYNRNDIAPSGMYLGPEISYAKMEFEDIIPNDKKNTATVKHFYAILKWGYQGRINGNFFFDLFAGAGYKNNSFENELNGTNRNVFEAGSIIYDFPIKLSLGFNMGILI